MHTIEREAAVRIGARVRLRERPELHGVVIDTRTSGDRPQVLLAIGESRVWIPREWVCGLEVEACEVPVRDVRPAREERR